MYRQDFKNIIVYFVRVVIDKTTLKKKRRARKRILGNNFDLL